MILCTPGADDHKYAKKKFVPHESSSMIDSSSKSLDDLLPTSLVENRPDPTYVPF